MPAAPFLPTSPLAQLQRLRDAVFARDGRPALAPAAGSALLADYARNAAGAWRLPVLFEIDAAPFGGRDVVACGIATLDGLRFGCEIAASSSCPRRVWDFVFPGSAAELALAFVHGRMAAVGHAAPSRALVLRLRGDAGTYAGLLARAYETA
jgi:hypothetical protein